MTDDTLLEKAKHCLGGSLLNPLSDIALERFSARNFERLAALIHRYSGIKMPQGKRTMLAGRLRSRLVALELDSLDDYCGYIFENRGIANELVHLINAVSTNKTDFFREPVHFDFLRETFLPALVLAGRRAVKIWSAAASIGAEAYTIAMVLEDFRRKNHGPDYSILGTDISTEALEIAVAGQFSKAMIDPVPPEMRSRYILQSRDQTLAMARIIPQLRAKVAWARLNLMESRYPVDRDMDCIFCRNILIYFDKSTQNNVLKRLCDHLRPGGYLILGHSESGAGAELPLVSVRSTIFRRL
ncbi:CheR family methyltransferase [Acidocella aminolytica]|uniref:Chemotaxis protein methyltransferase n=1 Tax=Acidocella aminolytica 101 = DSM 11237 TaxID=1120923 RepID=A0A0D6PCK8_9PROT|nr:protein-glutamate O-methyltransferase CheR [Acidocella aminolytica]GAN79091.1 chemotaxis methyltransferase CheR [Acidocella aminolytica 101 = DSM 11237]GBQ39990.1 chemotaxis methyl-accepting protein [Acidocella aminolytica 101 = DSM 11237]SHF14388.1 chemotaxis protein methyltransferase CheR [Acidocella aminolytica 101 = DSM 11237]